MLLQNKSTKIFHSEIDKIDEIIVAHIIPFLLSSGP